MSIRTYVWKAADLTRAWDQLTDFAKDVTTYINQQRVTADIANAAVTSDKLAAVPFLSLMRDASLSIPSGGASATLIPMTLMEREAGMQAPAFDVTNGRAVIRREGLYRVSGSIHCAPAVAPGGSHIECIVQVDGAQAFIASAAAVNAPITVQASKTLQLSVSQTIELRCYQTTGVGLALSTGADRRPRLQIEYVGGL
jgi:hypothetical protein